VHALLPPGVRAVNPDAEAARLAQERGDPPGRQWGIRHAGPHRIVRPYLSRGDAAADLRHLDDGCADCDGPHALVFRDSPHWQDA
jgi:hypothetical protein